MDGILQFLLIIGIIVIGIAKQYKKEAKKNADNRSAMPLPQTETTPATKKGYQFSSSKHIFSGDSANTSTERVTDPLKQKTSPSPHPPQTSETDSEYSIHSEEEARKAIIWSEILQRKY